jgi:4-diphosphocytidyl-2-C-methyl-D-erythritol kinase
MKIIINSHAKINLGLNVIRKREDGFHDIETIFYPVELCDRLTFHTADEFSFCCDPPIPNTDTENNLIVRAVRLVEKYIGRKLSVSISVEKYIPVGAGLGGGSSNAAVTLLSLNDLFALDIPEHRLNEIALQLGSDVPFFLKPQSAYATGRGEQLTRIDLEIDKPIVLINPGIHVNTAWAYQQIIPAMPEKPLKDAIQDNATNLKTLLPYLKNDFEPAVMKQYPLIGEIKAKMYEMGALFAMMSGSGSTVFGIFEDDASAKKAKEYFSKRWNCWG